MITLDREEQARQEVAHTRISRRHAVGLTYIFLFVIFLVPLIQTFLDISHGQGSLPSLSNLSEWETQLEENSFFRKALIPQAQGFLTNLFGLGNEKVILGGDWLFYSPGVWALTAPPGPQKGSGSPLEVIMDFHSQLQQRGIQLLILPAPIKPLYYPQKISPSLGEGDTPLSFPGFDDLKTKLEAQGIWVYDPQPLLTKLEKESGIPLFLRTDTHWRPETVYTMARDLAAYISQKDLLTKRNPHPLSLVPITISHTGDIAQMLPLEEQHPLLAPEEVPLQQVVVKNNQPWREDREGEILFLGDSFANIYSHSTMGWGESAGLVEHLSFYLNAPIDRIVQNDQGAFATRQALQKDLARGRNPLSGKKILIWEMAIRELTLGRWESLSLEQGEPRASTFYTPPEGTEVEATGLILQTSSRPLPGTTPYKDHIMSLHITDAQITGYEEEEVDILVYAYSMKDNQRTPISHYRPGQTIHIRLQNWYEVSPQYNSINRSELEDYQLLLEDPAWVTEVFQ